MDSKINNCTTPILNLHEQKYNFLSNSSVKGEKIQSKHSSVYYTSVLGKCEDQQDGFSNKCDNKNNLYGVD